MTKEQKAILEFSLLQHPDPTILFRDIKQSFSRIRVSQRMTANTASGAVGGRVIANAVIPNSLPLICLPDGHPDTLQERFVLGRESLALQGFPIELLEHSMFAKFPESKLQDLAGNMVSTTVFLAIMMATVCSVSWHPEPERQEVAPPTPIVPRVRGLFLRVIRKYDKEEFGH